MVEEKSKDEVACKEEGTMRMLFEEELVGIAEDGFDGSRDEHQIFMEVFYGNNGNIGSNSFSVSRASDFQSDESSHSKRILNVNRESSALISYCSVKNVSGEYSERASVSPGEQIQSECILESSSSWAGVYAQDPVDKQMKLSSMGQSSYNNEPSRNCLTNYGLVNLESAKVSSDVLMQDPLHICQSQSCGVVETCSQHILSSYYPLTGQGEWDDAGHADVDIEFDIKGADQVMEYDSKTADAKSVMSPISQESFASGNLVAGALIPPVEMPGTRTCMNQSLQEYSIMNSAKAKVASKRAFIRDLPDRLRAHAHDLLKDAGWKIEPRVRSDRTKMASYFTAPENRLVVTSLSQAWKACGQRLYASSLNSEQDKNGREWADIDTFWNDLTDTLAFIEKKIQLIENSLPLLQRWKFLDPFMAVVCINKKISVLREGRTLKAVNSSTLVISGKNSMVSEDQNTKMDNCLRLTNMYSSSSPTQAMSTAPELKCKTEMTGPSTSHQALQHYHDMQSRREPRHVKQKVCCCSEAHEMLNSHPRHRDMGLHDTKYLHNKNTKGSATKQNRTTGSASKFTFGDKDADTTDPNSYVTDLSAQVPVSDSPSPNSQPAKVACACTSCIVNESKQKALLSPKNKAGLVHRKASWNSSAEDAAQLQRMSPVYRETRDREDTCSVHKEDLSVGFDFVMGSSITAEKGVSLETSKSELESSAAKSNNDSVKKSRKRSKKISEIESNGLNCESSGDCRKSSNQEVKEWTESTKGESKLRNLSARKATSIISSQLKMACLLKDQHKDPDFEESSLASDDGHIPKELHGNNEEADVLDPNTGVPSEAKITKMFTKPKKFESWKEIRRKRPHPFHVNDDDLLITAIIKNKALSFCSKFSLNIRSTQPKAVRKLKSKKIDRKLLFPTPGKGGKNSLDRKQFTLGGRTVLWWLIEMGVVSLKDVVQYRNLKNNAVIKDGWVTRDGILCNCCTNVLSVSNFKAHAGSKLPKSSLNLFLQSGKSFTLCQLEAWSAECRTRKSRMIVMEVEEMDQNDDTCGICGDGGELLCCDSCPSTYHKACLAAQEFPEGSWYCHNCICQNCENSVSEKEVSSSLAILECSQCEHKYHDTCIKENIIFHADVGSDSWFCGVNCQEIHLGLRSRVGVVNCLDDGFAWTILRCNHDEQKVYAAQKIALMAECNTKLAIALTIMEECFLPMVDPRTGIDMIPQVLYNLGSDFARLNYQGFYTVVLEKNDEVISVASIRVHGTTVAEMPLIATYSEYRRQGMCRRLMDAIEKMLRLFKVKMLLLSAIPHVVDTWTTGFGFKHIEDDEKKQLKHINLMLFPGTSMLTKILDQPSVGKSGEESELYVREDHFQDFGEPGQINRTDIEGLHAGSDADAKSLPPVNMTSVELVDNQLEDLQLSFCGNDPLPAKQIEHDAVRDIHEFSSAKMETSYSSELDIFCSTTQDIITQMAVEESEFLNADVILDTSAPRAIDKDEHQHFEGGDLKYKSYSDASELHKGRCLPEEGQCWTIINSNIAKLEQFGDKKDLVDDPIGTSKDELCGPEGCNRAANLCSVGNTES